MKIQIKKNFSLKVLFETEAESMKEALEKAVKQRVDLRDANLRGAYLVGAYLGGAYLRGADLRGANLRGAYLEGADLRGADLRVAYLRGSDLGGADLGGAYLVGTNLRDANWDDTKKDMLEKLALMPDEVPYLYKAIHDGKINGSVYEGECACFCGTLANAKQIPIDSLPIEKNVDSHIEKFFLGIRQGDNPENNLLSKLASEWIEEFSKERNIVLPKRKVVWE